MVDEFSRHRARNPTPRPANYREEILQANPGLKCGPQIRIGQLILIPAVPGKFSRIRRGKFDGVGF